MNGSDDVFLTFGEVVTQHHKVQSLFVVFREIHRVIIRVRIARATILYIILGLAEDRVNLTNSLVCNLSSAKPGNPCYLFNEASVSVATFPVFGMP